MTAAVPSGAPPTTRLRLTALDGLRGVAALVVVLHHASLLAPSVSAIYVDGAPPPAPGGPAWWVTTPLAVFQAGEEAVLVFFVLSGLVVALPALRPGFDWFAYYPRRVVRLFVPVAGAVIFAAIIIVLTPQTQSPINSSWVNGSSIPGLGPEVVVQGLDLISGQFTIDNPLWSLRWELIFSLLLPVYVVTVVAARRRLWVVVVGAAVILPLAIQWGAPSAYYLPIFLFGTVMAMRIDSLRKLGDVHSVRGHLLWASLLLISLLLLVTRWIVWPFVGGPIGALAPMFAFTALGACGIVLIAFAWRPLGTLLTLAPVAWLGRISFSLYLIHVPVLIGIISLMPTRPLVAGAIGIVASLVVAELFFRFVEGPAHRLARVVGQRSRSTLDSPS